MHTVTRVFTRSTMLALALCAVITASAGAAQVNIRVEGATATRANAAINTGPRSVSTANSSCVADGGGAAATNPTAITAAADWADSAGAAALFGFGGSYLCGLAGEIGGASSYWLMKINNKTQNPPGTYLDGSTKLTDGDTVLWYFTDDYAKPTLDVVAAQTVGVGQTLSGRVDSWDGATDSVSAAAGVSVTGGGASATTGADGLFSVSFTAPGKFMLSATKTGAIRGSLPVTVTAAPQPVVPVPPVRTNRFAACAGKHRKGSAGFRRCVRAVRAKQSRECRSATARESDLCKKVLARGNRG
ncbi:MAG: hypothetical protein HY827_06110 [Actinobacteria bacterium]|nr:hypothetical protein [Actinomycetota bacterium]